MLKKLGIVIGDNKKTANLFEELFSDFMEFDYTKPSEYIKSLWSKYEAYPVRNSNINGTMFEYILASLCIREGILPIYMNSKVAFVPNVSYDLMFYSAERGPICWSVKTSLRERYKQADLEAIALKYVHRRALSFLVTLDEGEAQGVKSKIKSGDVIGLDKVIVATNPEFDELVEDLKTFKFEEPPIIKVITSSKVVTIEKVKATFP